MIYLLIDLYICLDSERLVDLLIANGANVNQANLYKMTPLHRAVSQGKSYVYHKIHKIFITKSHSFFLKEYIEFAKQLIKNGANVNVKNNDGKTPLDIAIGKSNSHLTKSALISQEHLIFCDEFVYFF